MLKNPSEKYRRFRPVHNPDRRWPEAEILAPPTWCSVDLRDGNQALIEPMDGARKRRLFDELVRIGFKEIEVGFPSASQTDFDFVRQLVEEDAIPDDVTIQVLTQAREDLITRTFEALEGAPRVIFHLYHATAPVMRRVVFGMTREQVVEDMALRHVRMIRDGVAARPETQWTFQYSPEMFSATELDFTLEIVDAVTAEWAPTPQRPCIVNLPSTVETCTPNVFADMVETVHRRMARRDAVVLSVHPHNDRGTGTAAAEMALMAGADRLEGCLFGNGERTGNLDVVNVALNLYTQGVHPGLDLADIDRVRTVVEHCNQLRVPERHPYVGDLVYTSFSGSHQDAIRKAMAARDEAEPWDVPYLPVDPKDLGRSYQAVIRVNSQSGKGGITFLLERDHGIEIPRRAQIEFSQSVQRLMDAEGGELSSDAIWSAFDREYIQPAASVLTVRGVTSTVEGNRLGLRIDAEVSDGTLLLEGSGESAPVAAANALLDDVEVIDALERPPTPAREAHYCFVELRAGDGTTCFGAGLGEDAAGAAARAVASAAGRGLGAFAKRHGALRDSA